MITVIKTDSGSYNVFITRDGMFVLQGNITKAELKGLQAELKKALK
jgi:hypothetical protein